jgi:hypothetical protein
VHDVHGLLADEAREAADVGVDDGGVLARERERDVLGADAGELMDLRAPGRRHQRAAPRLDDGGRDLDGTPLDAAAGAQRR